MLDHDHEDIGQQECVADWERHDNFTFEGPELSGYWEVFGIE